MRLSSAPRTSRLHRFPGLNFSTLKNKQMRKMKIIYWMVVLEFLMGCGQGKVSMEASEQPVENVTKKEEATSPREERDETKEVVTAPRKKKREKLEKPSDNADSVYPKEYDDPQGMERYLKIREGVYAYSKSYSGIPYQDELSRLDFFDKTGKKINEFDVRKNNPYTNEAIPNLVAENYQAYVYNSFIPKSETGGKVEYAPKQYMTFSQRPSAEQDHIPVIGYHLLGSSHEGYISDWKFTAICLDEKGNILRKFENLDIDPYEFCISENKKFFCVAYGGLRGENLTRLRNNGFRIYDIETGELVYEISVDERHSILGPGIYSKIDFGVISISGNDFSDDIGVDEIIINYKKREIYKRRFKYEETKYMFGTDENGFNMYDRDNNRRWKLDYDKDFITEKF